MDEKMTKFEKDLQAYFPEIYKLHQLGKVDQHLWQVVDAMLAMHTMKASGVVRIRYTEGFIEEANKEERLLYGKRSRPGY